MKSYKQEGHDSDFGIGDVYIEDVDVDEPPYMDASDDYTSSEDVEEEDDDHELPPPPDHDVGVED